MCSRRLRRCGKSADRIRYITTIRSRPGRSSLTGACSMFNWRERLLLLSACMIAAASPASAEDPGHYGYGTVAPTAQIAGWEIDPRIADGAGSHPGKVWADRRAVL